MATWTYQSYDGPYQRPNGWWVVYLVFQEAGGEQRSVTLKFATRPTAADVTAKRPAIKAILDSYAPDTDREEVIRNIRDILNEETTKAQRFDDIVTYLQTVRGV